MRCSNCRWSGRCDGAACFYDHIRERREQEPDYEEEKWYMVDTITGMAFSDKAYSKRDIDAYRDSNPDDDLHRFLEKAGIEADPDIHWDIEDHWLAAGRKDAQKAVRDNGIETVYGWWKGHSRDELKLKLDIGFYDEIMRQAEAAGLKGKQ